MNLVEKFNSPLHLYHVVLSNSSYLSVYQVLQLEEKLFRIKGILSPQKKNALTSGDLLNEPMTGYPRTILKASSTHKEEKKE